MVKFNLINFNINYMYIELEILECGFLKKNLGVFLVLKFIKVIWIE